MSIGMSFYPQAVVLKGKVYVGGGDAVNTEDNTLVMCYNIERNQWSALPQFHSMYFAMTVTHNPIEKLVLVGGRDVPTYGRTSTLVRSWDETRQQWMQYVSNMPSACDAPTVIEYKGWLIVIGGRDDYYQSLSKVDILGVQDCQWYSGAPLPQPAHKMTAAVISNTLVLLGGAGGDNVFFNKVFSVHLDILLCQAVHLSRRSALASPWQSLPDIPVPCATALVFNGALLAVGGNKPDESSATRVHLFKSSTKTWIEAGQLLVDRWRCACTVLPSGEIFIAGGATRAAGGQVQREVHIAQRRDV